MTTFQPRRPSARLALALLLLLSTQLALAGQLCRGVMAGGGIAGQAMLAPEEGAGDRTQAARPCCSDTVVSAADCPTAVVAATKSPDGSFVKAQIGGAGPATSPPPVMTASFDAASSVPFPAVPAGLALPVYILFGRFVS